MASKLDAVFEELGISQYLAIFLDQGFDTWETILDITESDLDALGVKLGHRRKLQRKIINERGLTSQTTPVALRRSSSGDSRSDHRLTHEASATSRGTLESSSNATQKRKYRRHPKADENAPERPPSAYVLFSNKMRENFKGQNLTFTEIAKLVGENWQNITHEDKAPFENSAQQAKDKYNMDLVEYKKTADYRKYSTYLQDFKAKHNTTRLDKDASKRIKLSRTNLAQHSSGSVELQESSRNDSTSDAESPPLSSPRRRFNSGISSSHMQRSVSRTSLNAEPSYHITLRHGSSHADSIASSDATSVTAGRSNSLDNPRLLPPLADVVADVIDPRNSAAGSGLPFGNTATPRYTRPRLSGSPRPSPSISSTESRMPSLQHEHSSISSDSSRNSFAFPLTPVETALPIHALVNNPKPMGIDHAMGYMAGYVPARRTPSPDSRYEGMSLHRGRAGMDSTASSVYPVVPLRNYPSDAISVSGLSIAAASPVINALPPISSMAPSFTTPLPPVAPSKSAHKRGPSEAGFDGMSALLQAGEMVDRQGR